MSMRSINNTPADIEGADNLNLCELIPWLLNGTLEPAQARELEPHLARCMHCREALELWRAVQCQQLNESVHIGDTEIALCNMNRRLDRYVAASDSGTCRRKFADALLGAFNPLHWMAFAGLALIVVAGNVYWNAHAARYATLSESSAPVAIGAHEYRFRVLFRHDISAARKRAILNQFNGRVVAGPTARGVYTVAVPIQSLQPRQIAAMLRHQREVLVAEWISKL